MATNPPGVAGLPRHADLTPNQLVKRYGFRGAFSGTTFPLIKIEPAQSHGNITRHVSHKSLGDLDYFPPEVLREIIKQMDTLTLIRFAATCLRSRDELSSFHVYQAIMRHAPRVLAAFGKTGLLCHFTLETIWQTIQSSACASCGMFAANLFLPSCEKLCGLCISANPAYRVVVLETAVECFSLTPDQLKTLPLMTRVPRHIAPVTNLERVVKRKFVAVKHAKALSMALYGWTAISKEHIRATTIPASRHDQYLRFLNAPLGPLEWVNDNQPRVLPRTTPALTYDIQPYPLTWTNFARPNDGWFNIACVACPTAHDLMGDREDGFKCRGCLRLLDRFLNRSYVLTGGFNRQAAWNLRVLLNRKALTAYTRASFQEHARECPGAKILEPVYWGDIPGNRYAHLA